MFQQGRHSGLSHVTLTFHKSDRDRKRMHIWQLAPHFHVLSLVLKVKVKDGTEHHNRDSQRVNLPAV